MVPSYEHGPFVERKSTIVLVLLAALVRVLERLHRNSAADATFAEQKATMSNANMPIV